MHVQQSMAFQLNDFPDMHYVSECSPLHKKSHQLSNLNKSDNSPTKTDKER